MEQTLAAINYELQETADVDAVIAKIVGWMRERGMDDEATATDLRHYFRNSDNQGRRFPRHSRELY